MRRRAVISLVVAVVVVAAIAAGIVGIRLVSAYRASHGPECTVPRPTASDAAGFGTVTARADASPLGLDAVQLQHAATINAVGVARSASPRARVIAIATAWQESALRNLDHGDRDSLGLFQQRPSQGWGNPSELMDPVYAAGQFYDHLAKVPGWQHMSLTQAAQAVQRSALPDAYAKWESDAVTLAVALGGAAPVALSCRTGATASTAAAPTRPALPGTDRAGPRLGAVLADAGAELTGVTVDAIATGGRSATVTVALPGTPASRAGRILAAWLVAHATTMGVTSVDVGARQWSGHRWEGSSTALAAGAVAVAVGGD